MSMPPPGLVVLHGNRLELLQEAVVHWMRQHPLAPLTEEIILVNSIGTAEWVKSSLAESLGVCAATRVELPGRFLWRSYRKILGRAVAERSPLNRQALIWRIMKLALQDTLPAPLAAIVHLLRAEDLEARYGFACEVADLFDQYQNYRSTWLADWIQGRNQLTTARGEELPVPPDQAWQPALWRCLWQDLSPAERAFTLPALHQQVLERLQRGGEIIGLPPRILVFGVSTLPHSTLQILDALAHHCQVLVALLNPCRFHWSDIVEGRELWQAVRRRQPWRHHHDFSMTAFEDMHLHAHPLLAAWGRQGRDFMRQLDAYAPSIPEATDLPRIDLFDERTPHTLLEEVQCAIRDLLPLAEHPRNVVAATDRSLVFHRAHSPLREVQVLQDQLLDLLTQSSPALQPRQIVVMIPALEDYVPFIEAVFDRYESGDPRFIPYEIALSRPRLSTPLIQALKWLLALDQHRITASEVRSLLEVPALAQHFELDADGVSKLSRWADASGIRWGLDDLHRASLELGACGDQNTWHFGLERLWLGYANGSSGPFDGIEPYPHLSGLEATVLGSLARFIETLKETWEILRSPAPPAVWVERGRQLLDDWFDATNELENLSLGLLHEALSDWLTLCQETGFADPIPLSLFRRSWFDTLEEPKETGRFLSGGVTFCTLLPLRALPFEVICLLGMNLEAFPRRAAARPHDLMQRPGMPRPGDRARQEDDRALMLDTLLAARRVLSISWCGRDPRDDSERPPSVLVAQLRDYLMRGWRPDENHGYTDLLAQQTRDHPLQPFSRRYFEENQPIHTYAGEWRRVFDPALPEATLPPLSPQDPPKTLSLGMLGRFLRNPVRFYLESIPNIHFEEAQTPPDEEMFETSGLARHEWIDALITPPFNPRESQELETRLQRLCRAGQLPLAEMGQAVMAELRGTVTPMLETWGALQERYPCLCDKHPIHLSFGIHEIRDWLEGLRKEGDREPAAWVELLASRVLEKNGKDLQLHKLLPVWLRHLVASATGHMPDCHLVAQDIVLTLRAPASEEARAILSSLVELWQEGHRRPLPMALKSAFTLVRSDDLEKTARTYEGTNHLPAERDRYQERIYPTFASLNQTGEFEALTRSLAFPLWSWARDAVLTPLASAHE